MIVGVAEGAAFDGHGDQKPKVFSVHRVFFAAPV